MGVRADMKARFFYAVVVLSGRPIFSGPSFCSMGFLYRFCVFLGWVIDWGFMYVLSFGTIKF